MFDKKNKTFADDDQMDRKRYAASIKKIIEQRDNFKKDMKENDGVERQTGNYSFTIAISSPWGSGKTQFVEMLMDDMKEDEKGNYSLVYYDAWKNDFYDSAFESLYMSMIDQFKSNGDIDDAVLGKYESIGKAFITLGKSMLANKAGITDEAIEKARNEATGAINEQLRAKAELKNGRSDFFIYEGLVKSLHSILENHRVEVSKDEDGKEIRKLKPIIIFVDELDRCRPDFAIKTLETIKHLFNIQNIIFVFTLDLGQLQHSVKAVYGSEFDAVGYLERFFDYTSLLPETSQRELFNNAMTIYFDAKGNDEVFSEELKTNMYQICYQFHLTAREIHKVLFAYTHLYENVVKDYDCIGATLLYFYLLVAKFKYPVQFYQATYPNDEEARRQLFGKYPLQFPFETREAQEDCLLALIQNLPIGNGGYHIYDSKGNRRPLMYKKGDSISEGNSCDMVLYANDLKSMNDASHGNWRLMRYLLHQLELSNVSVEKNKQREEEGNEKTNKK